MDARAFVSYQVRSEQQLRSPESGWTDLEMEKKSEFVPGEQQENTEHGSNPSFALHLKCFHLGERTEPSQFLKSHPFVGWERGNRLSAMVHRIIIY